MRYALAGASGLVGRALAAAVSADPGCIDLQLLLRRPVPALALLPRARTVNWQGGAVPPLATTDIALCALGTTIKAAGSQQAFRAVDVDAVLAFAQAAQQAGARRFGLVSALGADPASSVFYNRSKGEVEQAIAMMGFECLVIARPSLLTGDRRALGQPVRWGEAAAQALAAPLAWVTPLRWRPIQAELVARALLSTLSTATPGVWRLESDELQRRGRPA